MGEEAGSSYTHQNIITAHSQYAYRRYFSINGAAPYLSRRKCAPKKLLREILEFKENSDDSLYPLVGFLVESKVEYFVRFLEALGDSILPSNNSDEECRKNHTILIRAMSEDLEKITNADEQQVERIRAVVEMVSTQNTSSKEEIKVSYQANFIKPGIYKCFQRDKPGDSWVLADPTHGIKINISRDSVPHNIDKFAIVGRAYLNGDFRIPDDYEICTAIFTINISPDFHFGKPVVLSLPHSAIFEDDDDSLVILRADDPIQEKTEHPVYHFNDIITDVDYTEDFYLTVKLHHFCTIVGAKRKTKIRNPRHHFATIGSRRRRVKKFNPRRKIKKACSGGSQQSSYESSFADLTPRPSSSLSESSKPSPNLQRQEAIDQSVLHDTSSEEESTCSCNEIIIHYINPINCSSKWTSRFIVSPNHPTGQKAAHDVVSVFKKKYGCQVELQMRSAFPTQQVIEFMPEVWCDEFWTVKATSTPSITLGLVKDIEQSGSVPFVDFRTETLVQTSPPQLQHTVTVSGVEILGKNLYFTLSSSNNLDYGVDDIIKIKTWIYTEGSTIVSALQDMEMNDTDTIVLDPELSPTPAAAEIFKADLCRLVADISFQVGYKFSSLLERVPISKKCKRDLRHQHSNNETECLYHILLALINKKHPHLLELKQLLETSGLKLVVSSTNDPTKRLELTQRQPEYERPELCQENEQQTTTPIDRDGLNQELCEYQQKLFASLAEKLNIPQWRFLGRYLGLGDKCDGDLSHIIVTDQGIGEAVIKTLNRWRMEFGHTATLTALLKVLSWLNELNYHSIQAPVTLIENIIQHLEVDFPMM